MDYNVKSKYCQKCDTTGKNTCQMFLLNIICSAYFCFFLFQATPVTVNSDEDEGFPASCMTSSFASDVGPELKQVIYVPHLPQSLSPISSNNQANGAESSKSKANGAQSSTPKADGAQSSTPLAEPSTSSENMLPTISSNKNKKQRISSQRKVQDDEAANLYKVAAEVGEQLLNNPSQGLHTQVEDSELQFGLFIASVYLFVCLFVCTWVFVTFLTN